MDPWLKPQAEGWKSGSTTRRPAHGPPGGQTASFNLSAVAWANAERAPSLDAALRRPLLILRDKRTSGRAGKVGSFGCAYSRIWLRREGLRERRPPSDPSGDLSSERSRERALDERAVSGPSASRRFAAANPAFRRMASGGRGICRGARWSAGKFSGTACVSPVCMSPAPDGRSNNAGR
jgi:hypothetical protein